MALKFILAIALVRVAIECLIYACLSGCLFLAGAVLLGGPAAHWAAFAFSAAAVSGVALVQGLLRLEWRKRLDRLAE